MGSVQRLHQIDNPCPYCRTKIEECVEDKDLTLQIKAMYEDEYNEREEEERKSKVYDLKLPPNELIFFNKTFTYFVKKLRESFPSLYLGISLVLLVFYLFHKLVALKFEIFLSNKLPRQLQDNDMLKTMMTMCIITVPFCFILLFGLVTVFAFGYYAAITIVPIT